MIEKAFISIAEKSQILLRSDHNQCTETDFLVLCIILNTVQLDCFSLLVLRGPDSNSSKEGAQLSGWGPQILRWALHSSGYFHIQEKALTSSPSLKFILPVLVQNTHDGYLWIVF